MRLTEAQAEELVKNSKCRIRGDLKPSKKGRVSSRKIHFDGLMFDSRIEMDVYREYKIDPDVVILETQPVFLLQAGFSRNGKKYRPISYKADFLIKEKGVEIVVEVKSEGTLRANAKSYPMRKKMFLKKFPELLFREIIFKGKRRIVNDL